MNRPLKLGIAGLGTVGTGLLQLLAEHGPRLAGNVSRPIEVVGVCARSRSKPRAVTTDAIAWFDEAARLAVDPSIDVFVELIGGEGGAAKTAVEAALNAGKSVVTANKALLAKHGADLAGLAEQQGVALQFEAAVAGGIPVIKTLREALAGNQLRRVYGILNGTCNYILTGMTEQGRSYTDVLAEAQAKGYAEADPTLDVDGTDAAHKLAILVQIAFGVAVPLPAIPRRGIAGIDLIDIRFAHELGYTIKLLAEAFLDPANGTDEAGGQLALHVAPVMLKHARPLALVRDAYNAITVVGDAVGTTLYYGRGAGPMPTASAVIADVIDLAVGHAQLSFRTLRLWSGHNRDITLRPQATMPSRFYLRLMVQDRPGVLADVTRALANHRISI